MRGLVDFSAAWDLLALAPREPARDSLVRARQTFELERFEPIAREHGRGTLLSAHDRRLS